MSTALEREHSHRRFNPLRNEWVLVSPHRLKRPWQGKVEKLAPVNVPRHDPSNPLCPGVLRANGERTPEYTSTYVFPNDFPALEPPDTFGQLLPGAESSSTAVSSDCERSSQGAEGGEDDQFFFRNEPAAGRCDVVCFHPHSDKPIPRMQLDEVRRVIDCWCEAYSSRSRDYEWVQVFENRGDTMGCSNAHPHGQIWSCAFLPNEAERELRSQLDYFARRRHAMLHDYVQQELLVRERELQRVSAQQTASACGGQCTALEQSEGHRIVLENASWLCVVPYWAVWPFETLLIAKRRVSRLDELNELERTELASVLRSLLVKYDNLFECSFPYSGGWHAAPGGRFLHDRDAHDAWQLHAHFYPPLLRSATIRKFLVGFEMLAEPQRDLTPERAARMLRQLDGEVHFADRAESAHANQ